MTGTAKSEERVGVVVIHGVGETEPGWINDYFIPYLQRRDPGLVFVDHSEVHDLPDRGRTRPNARFKAYLRRSQFRPEQPITIMELFWADLSRVGHGAIANFFVMLQLFYEAPMVLGAAFMRQKQTGLRWVLNTIIRFANWLLRWPITGLNTAVFACAVVMLFVQHLRSTLKLDRLTIYDDAIMICAVLALLTAWSLWIARRNVHKGILLTDIALSTAIFSAVLIAATIVLNMWESPENLKGPAPYLLWASYPIFSLWLVWSAAVVAGIVILTVLTVANWFSGAKKRDGLMRPAAALGLSTVQGVLWKIVISLLWFFLISSLEIGTINKQSCPKSTAGSTIEDTQRPRTACELANVSATLRGVIYGAIDAPEKTPCEQLADINDRLLGIFILNTAMAIVLGIGLMGIMGLRSLVVRYRGEAVRQGKAWLPRLIISPLLVFLMFTLTVVNFIEYYGPIACGDDKTVFFDIYNWLKDNLQDVKAILGGTSAAFIFYLILLRVAQKASRGLLHIARDLVDHQYRPEFLLSSFMLPKGRRLAGRHPRRERIQARFDALMDTIVAQEKCRRLVIVAHSQGSVLLFDYLKSTRDNRITAATERIDIVTLGSPLGHFYQHYLPVYESSLSTAERLNPKLASWTNLWRMDDPIGNRVEVVKEGFIKNEMLPPGGHINYWREPRVCEVILDLVEPGRERAAGKLLKA